MKPYRSLRLRHPREREDRYRRSSGAFSSLKFLLPLLLFAHVGLAQQGSETLLLRYPDVHGQEVVFTYAGDLWIAPIAGGVARRLTSHPGVELFAKFSPDGRWIAFTGQYDGDYQVQVIPRSGGEPRQLTFYPARGSLAPRFGPDNQVYDWTADGKAVLFRSLRDAPFVTEPKLHLVPVAGGAAQALPMETAGAGALSPDGRRILYSPHFNDFRPWKRYQGGWARDLWIFDLANRSAKQVTSHERTDGDPMWSAAGLFFNSDRTGRLNLYRLDEATLEVTPLTTHEDADVRWPSAADDARIVYELNGRLQLLDLRTRTSDAISIHVPTDAVGSRPHEVSVQQRIEHATLSPDGRRAGIVARGDIFTLPVGEGLTRNLTQTPGVHEREMAWSPDGASIAYVSDQSGEEELWIADAANRSAPRQITRGHRQRFYQPEWSADGQWIAISDKNSDIHVVEVATGNTRKIGASNAWYIREHRWSPDGRYLAYVKASPAFTGVICLWDRQTNRTHELTDPTFSSYTPTWDPGGNYLYFLSEREPTPLIDAIEWNYAVDRTTSIYALALRPSVAHPFAERAEPLDENKKSENGKDQPTAAAAAIEFDGIRERVIRVPLDADNYSALVATADRLLYRKHAPRPFDARAAKKPTLMGFKIDARKEEKIADEAMNFWASSSGERVLVDNGEGKLRVVGGPEPVNIDVGSLRTRRDPRAEWSNIFDEVWRRYRDFYYLQGMPGTDWNALRKRYRALLPHVGHQSDLAYLINEMIGELNVSHAYIQGGDEGLPAPPATGLLGARFNFDPQAQRYKITEIFAGDPFDRQYRSPLAEFGAQVEVGDFIHSINGRTLEANVDPYVALRGTAGKLVEIVVGKAGEASTRTLLVRTLESESPLLYARWVGEKRRAVESLSKGRIGYVHIPNMGGAGLREFIKWYYGQIRKDAIIIDDRYNDGGNVSRMILDRITRRHYGVGYVTGVQHPTTYPWGNYTHVFTGPMALLINGATKSDGEAFAWAFKDAKVGSVIGTRTWGGTVGTGSDGPVLDGMTIGVPQYELADREGKTIVEGRGVEPDIEVMNDPASTATGRDPQLERAVQTLLERAQSQPAALPERPAQ